MPDYYPAFLDLRGRLCVVIGGGQVAQRKVEALLQAGARVKVIGQQSTPGLRRLAKTTNLNVESRSYQAGDLAGAWLAIAATDDPEVNSAVAAEAEARGILFNVVDDPDRCNFIAPSVLRRGEVTIAISTGGKSPALARKLRETLEAVLPEEYGVVLDILSQARQEAKRQGKQIPAQKWQESITPQIVALLRAGDRDKGRQAIMASLGLDQKTRTRKKPGTQIEYRCCGG